MAPPGSHTSEPPRLVPTEDELRVRYGAYRRRQAQRLVRLMPRDAIRPMYRRALDAGFGDEDRDDPLDVLVRFCGSLLPLPPFDVWLSDLTGNPAAHLRDVDDSAEAPTAAAPSTVDVRAFHHSGAPWIAHLRSFRDGTTWRGYIAFEEEASGRVHRTATVFREQSPEELLERFTTFDDVTLEAFLRSALP